MDYTMIWRETLAIFEETNLKNWWGHAHHIGLHEFHIDLYLHEFFEWILFLTPIVWREILAVFEGKQKEQNLQNQ